MARKSRNAAPLEPVVLTINESAFFDNQENTLVEALKDLEIMGSFGAPLKAELEKELEFLRSYRRDNKV